jgi:predicted regulator of Ras-like GTPase activity (Roadblock/LC7/MglB family)
LSVFAQILQRAMERVPGAQAAIFADWEGEAVDAFSDAAESLTEIRLIGAHWGVIYQQARLACEKLRLGDVGLVLLEFSRGYIIVRRITADYFVVVALQSEGSLGQALRVLDEVESHLLEEM